MFIISNILIEQSSVLKMCSYQGASKQSPKTDEKYITLVHDKVVQCFIDHCDMYNTDHF